MMVGAVFRTPLGWAGIVAGERGIKEIFLPVRDKGKLMGRIMGKYPEVSIDPASLQREIERIEDFLNGRESLLKLPLDLSSLSPFQRRVYRLARAIPYGRVRSYAWLARALGRPEAVRAVGNAMAHNPFPLVIPCHRVVRSDGHIGGFGGGPRLKAALLRLEGVRVNPGGMLLLGD